MLSPAARLVAFALASATLWLPGRAAAKETAEDAIDFNRDIAPVLSENCFFCHGPDPNQREAGLRLDVREEAIDMYAIVPGEVEASELVARIDADDVDMRMPPPESHKTLSDEQKELLRRWIAEGAPYEPHWSFQPRRRPEVPEVAEAPWVANPVDAFVLRRLEKKGIEPSPPAAAERLLRRLHLDLVGLPPSWEETQEFLNADDQGAAYSAAAERLFQSPHHGERMATGWLDVVRFADTVGFHGDQNQRIFPYRDWVIKAINDNMPFDRFTVLQLAGDLLPEATDSDHVATGFNRLNMMTREGGAQPEEYLTIYAADRVRTVGMAWMGLTTGCAQCHDHKFDPFTARDFYSLGAFFDDVKQWGVYHSYGYTPNPELEGWTNDHPFPPEIEVDSPFLQRRQKQLRSALAQLAADAAAAPEQRERLGQWQTHTAAWLAQHPDGWSVPESVEFSAGGEDAQHQSDGSYALSAKSNAEGEGAQNVRDFVIRDAGSDIASVRLELLPAERHEGRLLRDGRESTDVRLEPIVRGADGQERKLAWRRADADHYAPAYRGGHEVLGVAGSWKLPADRITDSLTAVYQLPESLRLEPEEVLVLRLHGDRLGRVRVAVSPLGRLRPLDASEVERTASGIERSDGAASISWLLTGAGSEAQRDEARRVETQYRECRDGRAWTMVTVSAEPRTTRILPRGNWQDQSGEVVLPATPAFLPTFEDPRDEEVGERRRTRLDLAQWLVHPDNPLVARVVVNRLWKHFFGEGLSPSVDDLGLQGEVPSHPELLDWLASELVDSGWDQRHVMRLIVTSNTYRQDSRVREELADIDPDNRLLAYHSPRRLEAEAVRDNALAVAGLLNLEMGGPSVHPYQPTGYYSNLQFPDRTYVADTGPDQYRRGLYTHWQRTFLHPMLANFDAPSREDCVAIRTRANTPQQALTLLNDPSFVEAARSLAGQILEVSGNDDARLTYAFHRVLQREPGEDELKTMRGLLEQQRAVYAADAQSAAAVQTVGLLPANSTEQPSETAAWIAVARALLNLHETITRY